MAGKKSLLEVENSLFQPYWLVTLYFYFPFPFFLEINPDFLAVNPDFLGDEPGLCRNKPGLSGGKVRVCYLDFSFSSSDMLIKSLKTTFLK